MNKKSENKRKLQILKKLSRLIFMNKSNVNPQELLAQLKEVIPRNGLVYSEKGSFSEILCKPKILPLKSLTLQKLEEMEKQLQMDSKNINN